MNHVEGRPDAILRPTVARGLLDVRRFGPSPDLGRVVDYHWLVRWALDAPHDQQVVPQPRVHIAAEDGRLVVHGITTRQFHRRLHGRGHVLGVSFRPAAFRAVLGRPVHELRGRAVPAREVLGRDDRPTARAILEEADPAAMVRHIEAWLRPLASTPDATAEEVGRWMAHAEANPSLCRVQDLAAAVGVSQRTLQRRFAEYVGIGPKWVLQRFRILEVAAIIHRGGHVDLAQVAALLGFSDQSHLTRAFTDVVGMPPDRYRRDTAR